MAQRVVDALKKSVLIEPRLTRLIAHTRIFTPRRNEQLIDIKSERVKGPGVPRAGQNLHKCEASGRVGAARGVADFFKKLERTQPARLAKIIFVDQRIRVADGRLRRVARGGGGAPLTQLQAQGRGERIA